MSRKSPEPGTPPVCSRSSSLRKNSDEYVSPSELSPGLLDLHSFDTELLSEVLIYFFYLIKGSDFILSHESLDFLSFVLIKILYANYYKILFYYDVWFDIILLNQVIFLLIRLLHCIFYSIFRLGDQLQEYFALLILVCFPGYRFLTYMKDTGFRSLQTGHVQWLRITLLKASQ